MTTFSNFDIIFVYLRKILIKTQMISKVGSYASLFVLFVKMPKIILKFISLLYIPFLIKSTISLSKQNQSVYIKKINSILNKQLTILFWYVKILARNDIEV